jgi:hypothetical protein
MTAGDLKASLQIGGLITVMMGSICAFSTMMNKRDKELFKQLEEKDYDKKQDSNHR